MRLNRLGIRARITGGSLLFAILISVVAGVIIRNQVVHIIYDGQVSVLRSITAPYRTALTTESTPELDPPGHEQEAAVVDPQGVVEINTLQRALRPQLQDLISRSMALQAKVRRLDTTIHAPATERAAIGNPLVPQLNRLKAAFER